MVAVKEVLLVPLPFRPSLPMHHQWPDKREIVSSKEYFRGETDRP
jgi:hypothetical protein